MVELPLAHEIGSFSGVPFAPRISTMIRVVVSVKNGASSVQTTTYSLASSTSSRAIIQELLRHNAAYKALDESKCLAPKAHTFMSPLRSSRRAAAVSSYWLQVSPLLGFQFHIYKILSYLYSSTTPVLSLEPFLLVYLRNSGHVRLGARRVRRRLRSIEEGKKGQRRRRKEQVLRGNGRRIQQSVKLPIIPNIIIPINRNHTVPDGMTVT